MLDALRKGAGTWVAKIFIALLVMSFAIWGVADVFTNFGQNVAAKVGDTEISTYQFERAYRQQLNRLGQQLGRPLSTTEGAQFGIPQQVLGTLVAEAALNETARRMGLGISDGRLAETIQTDPSFQGPGGRYDRSRLEMVLRNSGMTEDEFVIERRHLAERLQLAQGIAGGLKAPSVVVEALHAYQAEVRGLKYVTLEPALLGEIADPDDATLSTYYEAEKSRFRAPEYRKIALLELTPEKLARAEDVTDENARAEYERTSSRYFQPEKRKVRQISFPDAAEAAAAAEKLAGGATFSDLMQERSLSDNDVYLGLMAKADFLDAAIGDAAFALEEGATSGVVDGRFSPVILNILEVLPEQQQPFEEVMDELKTTLANEQAEREILDLIDEIEDARAGGALLTEIGERFNLTLTSPQAFDSTGKDENANEVSLPDAGGLLAAVFDSDLGVENDPLELGSQGFLWFEVSEVIPARDRDLDEVRDDVVADWKKTETEKRLQARAEELIAQAEAGATLEALAEAEGLEVKSAPGIQRGVAAGEISQSAATRVFSRPVGTVLEVPAAEGTGRLVVKVETASVPDMDSASAEVAEVWTRFGQQLQDSLLNQYVADIEAKAGVEVNEGSINQLIGSGDSRFN
jgi:peptidyl-prolyl cis-trans isomerase D